MHIQKGELKRKCRRDDLPRMSPLSSPLGNHSLLQPLPLLLSLWLFKVAGAGEAVISDVELGNSELQDTHLGKSGRKEVRLTVGKGSTRQACHLSPRKPA